MKPNIELLKRLQTRFRRMRHRQHFNMGAWIEDTSCGTAMCIAGHTLDLAGYKIRRRNGFPKFYAPSGRPVKSVGAAARKELGLSPLVTGGNGHSGLFYDFDLKTPRDAAERIGELIEEYS